MHVYLAEGKRASGDGLGVGELCGWNTASVRRIHIATTATACDARRRHSAAQVQVIVYNSSRVPRHLPGASDSAPPAWGRCAGAAHDDDTSTMWLFLSYYMMIIIGYSYIIKLRVRGN